MLLYLIFFFKCGYVEFAAIYYGRSKHFFALSSGSSALKLRVRFPLQPEAGFLNFNLELFSSYSRAILQLWNRIIYQCKSSNCEEKYDF